MLLFNDFVFFLIFSKRNILCPLISILGTYLLIFIKTKSLNIFYYNKLNYTSNIFYYNKLNYTSNFLRTPSSPKQGSAPVRARPEPGLILKICGRNYHIFITYIIVRAGLSCPDREKSAPGPDSEPALRSKLKIARP